MHTSIFNSFPRQAIGCALIALASLSQFQTFGEDLPQQVGIQEVIQMSLANEYSISIGKVEWDQAQQQERIASEPFEAQLSASASGYRDSNTNPNSFPYSVEGTQQSIGVQKSFSTGTYVSAELESSRFEDLSIPRSGEATLTINQNLLRGRSRAYNLAPIRIAGKQAEMSYEALRQTVIDTVSGVQFAYYDGVLADANLEVAKDSLALAEQLLRENKRRSEIGAIATSDLLQAESEVAAREEQVYQAEASLVRAKNLLKQYVSNHGMQAFHWKFSFRAPPIPDPIHIDVLEHYEQALGNRPDYRQATLNLEIGEIEQLRQSHAALPSVDLYVRMSMEGWGDSTEGTFNDVNSDENPDYAVGLNISRSISNRAAKARKSLAMLEQNRRNMSLLELEQAILLNLDSAAAQISSNWKRLKSATRSRELASRSLEAEQKRYQRGTSSTFILIRLQTDLANAKIRELIAANDYRKSIVEWERQTGVILDQHHIVL